MIYLRLESDTILFHNAATTPPSKATREGAKDLVTLPASPVKGTRLFPPVALGAADADAPVVPGTWKGPVVVGYGGTRLLTVPTSAVEEGIADVVELGVVGEG